MTPSSSTKLDEFLQEQLDIVDVLLSMYVEPEEISMSSSSSKLLHELRAHLAMEKACSYWDPNETNIVLKLRVPIVDIEETALELFLNISVPATRVPQSDHPESYFPQLSIERPFWLKRKSFDVLAAGLDSSEDNNVFEAVEYLQTAGKAVYEQENMDSTIKDQEADEGLTRVWFYLPSLSTREKRDDLVTLAPSYGLTGFVLAGKPGVLCVEGSASKVQAYLADIKRNSWGDIPSFQKKISERFREDNIPERKFCNMREITDDIERHGHKKNRGNLSQVEDFLKNAGLPDAFGRVFMQRE